VDWTWGLDWEDNLYLGAVPSSTQLHYSRIPTTLLLPFSAVIFFLWARKLLPKLPALMASLYFGFHPLVLLHTRRALSEAALVLGVCLFLFSISRKRINPVGAALALAIAVNSKLSGIFLLPVGIIAVGISVRDHERLRKMLIHLATFIFIFGMLTALFNPVFWKQPLQTIQVSIQERQLLTQAQINDHLGGSRLKPAITLGTFISNLFVVDPERIDDSVQAPYLGQDHADYLTNPRHNWGRGLIPGAVQISLFIFGVFAAIKHYQSYKNHQQRFLMLILISFLLLLGGILISIPIPWQRYTVPLLPFISLGIGFGLFQLLLSLKVIK
jgi:4-amino-4-deoxy-L-arabinose transferase-like glycosyltransferase